MYKTSDYNFIWPLEETQNVLVFNSLTTRLAEIPGRLTGILESKLVDPGGLSAEEKNLAGELIKDGFLVDESVDELKLIKYTCASHRYSKDVLSLTIAPTLDCNFKCTYCYQGLKPEGQMPEEVQDAILEYVAKSARKVDRLLITWFGGEPMLAKDIVYRLSREINHLAAKNGFSCTKYMVTNGSLLNNDSILRLKDLGVMNFQITLDGPPGVHNRRRILWENGRQQDNFGMILPNIKELVRNQMNVYIRVNIDSKNMDSTGELLDILESSGIKNVTISPGQISAYTDACKSIESSCINKKEFAELGGRFFEMLIRKGFKTDYSSVYPRRRANYCGADQINSFSVGPDGLIYKCWSDFGVKENNVGNIIDLSKGGKLNAGHISWLTWDPFDFSRCRKCKFLPICMGGCPHRGMKMNGGGRSARK